MSQRLHVGTTDDSVYDAVIASEADATAEQLADWILDGPWKIRIGDLDLYLKVQPAIAELFPRVFPDDVWVFSMGERSIRHPTEAELREWLDAGRVQGPESEC